MLGVALLVGRGIAGLAASVIIVRALGDKGRGQVVYVTNLVGLLALVSSSAALVGLTSLRNRARFSIESLNTAAVVVGAGTGGLLGLGYVVVALVTRTSASLTPELIVVVGVSTALLAVWMNVSVVAGLDNRLAAVTWTSLAGICIYLVITAITAATGTITVGNNIVAWMFTNFLPLFLLVWPARATRFSRVDVPVAVRQLLRFTVRANIATTSILAMWRIDQLVVGLRRGYAELGLYSVAVAIAEIVLVAAPAFRSALLPHHSMSEADLSQAVARVTRVVLAATIVVSGVLAAVGYPLLEALYGRHYGQTYPAMLLLLPGVALLVLHFPLFDYIAARRGVRALTVMGVGGVLFNVIADYMLLGRYSYVAAAAISSVTYAIVFGTCLALFVRQTDIPLPDVVVVRRRDLLAISKYFRELAKRSRVAPIDAEAG